MGFNVRSHYGIQPLTIVMNNAYRDIQPLTIVIICYKLQLRIWARPEPRPEL